MCITGRKGIESVETLASLKTGMMGPLAGIGDTLFHVIPSTIIGSLASYMALEGNPMAWFYGLHLDSYVWDLWDLSLRWDIVKVQKLLEN